MNPWKNCQLKDLKTKRTLGVRKVARKLQILEGKILQDIKGPSKSIVLQMPAKQKLCIHQVTIICCSISKKPSTLWEPHNVLREDKVPIEGGSWSLKLLPDRSLNQNGWLKIKSGNFYFQQE